jgi:beta-glucanase (GH16 family)
MTANDVCYDVKNGNLILRGIKNPGIPGDDSPYLTGGVESKKKLFNFASGGSRMVVRARFNSVRGSWPSIWMLPPDGWAPDALSRGEIDIMEGYHDGTSYSPYMTSTVHTPYTAGVSKTNPKAEYDRHITPGQYYEYGVTVYQDKLEFIIDGVTTLTYPRLSPPVEGQFIFLHDYFLILTMQLANQGFAYTLYPNDLPAEMHIDWVRYYEWK